jgi:hypothetical protein
MTCGYRYRQTRLEEQVGGLGREDVRLSTVTPRFWLSNSELSREHEAPEDGDRFRQPVPPRMALSQPDVDEARHPLTALPIATTALFPTWASSYPFSVAERWPRARSSPAATASTSTPTFRAYHRTEFVSERPEVLLLPSAIRPSSALLCDSRTANLRRRLPIACGGCYPSPDSMSARPPCFIHG